MVIWCGTCAGQNVQVVLSALIWVYTVMVRRTFENRIMIPRIIEDHRGSSQIMNSNSKSASDLQPPPATTKICGRGGSLTLLCGASSTVETPSAAFKKKAQRNLHRLGTSRFCPSMASFTVPSKLGSDAQYLTTITNEYYHVT